MVIVLSPMGVVDRRTYLGTLSLDVLHDLPGFLDYWIICSCQMNTIKFRSV